MDNILNVDTIDAYNRLFGVETMHPLVSVVDFADFTRSYSGLKRLGFYCVFYKELHCGTLQYGRSEYDYQDGTLVFVGPGHVVGVADGAKPVQNPRGKGLLFHPDFLYGTSLARRMKDYSFFSYDSDEALHMSERERAIILNCFAEIDAELHHAVDKHTKNIVASYIETMLNHCVRFYDRQFVTREVPNHGIIRRLGEFMHDWYDGGRAESEGVPSVQTVASAMCLSPNYFGDLVKKELGQTASDYIQRFVVDRAKELLSETEKNISEIAYELGFNYPHHLTRMFKKLTGLTPNEFRQTAV